MIGRVGKVFGVLVIATAMLNACSPPAEKPVVQKTAPSQMRPLPIAKEDEIIVELKPSAAKRQGRLTIKIGPNGMPNIQEPKTEALVRGEVNTGDETVPVYVPAQGPYVLKSKEKSKFENQSVVLSVDTNMDGYFPEYEMWFANKPVRIGNKMYNVREIDKDGTWMRLGRSLAPLSGAVLGRRAPDFKLTTIDGRHVSLDSYKGKVLLLDVWSMT